MVGAQDPARVMENYKLALDDGLDIANGGTGKRRAGADAAAPVAPADTATAKR
jgi:hypothetical protein